jgi:hypothetical protein
MEHPMLQADSDDITPASLAHSKAVLHELLELQAMFLAIKQAGIALHSVAETEEIEPDAIFHFSDWMIEHEIRLQKQWNRCRHTLRPGID